MTRRTTSNNHPRTFKGYAALERVGGPIIWGTLRPDAAEARKQFLHLEPGHGARDRPYPPVP